MREKWLVGRSRVRLVRRLLVSFCFGAPLVCLSWVDMVRVRALKLTKRNRTPSKCTAHEKRTNYRNGLSVARNKQEHVEKKGNCDNGQKSLQHLHAAALDLPAFKSASATLKASSNEAEVFARDARYASA